MECVLRWLSEWRHCPWCRRSVRRRGVRLRLVRGRLRGLKPVQPAKVLVQLAEAVIDRNGRRP